MSLLFTTLFENNDLRFPMYASVNLELVHAVMLTYLLRLITWYAYGACAILSLP